MADKKIRYEITADPAGFKKGFSEASAVTNLLDNSVKNLGRSVLSLGATYLGAQGIGAIIKTADTYANLDSKLKLATKSSAEFASSYDALFKMSQKTGSSFEANVTAFSGLAMAMKGTKVPTEELLAVFEDVNKSLVVAGASTVEASSFLLQFKQALGSNRLSGDEFKAMLEANSYWAGQFAKALDTDMAGLYKMKEAQELTTEVVLNAHKRMASGISADFDQMEKTVARATMELSNAWKDVIGDANRAGSGTKDLATVISGLATTITENKQTISDVFVGLIKGARITIETIADVSRSIQGLAIVAASKDKSLTDWIMGDADTMKQWQAEFANGTAFMKDRLVEVREKISDTADSWGKWSDKRDTLAALREEEQKLMAAIEERGKATGKANTEAAVSAGTAAVAISTFKDSWQVKRDLTISMSKEITDAEAKAFAESDKLAQKAAAERRKTVDEQLALQATLIDKVKEGTLSEHDYKVWALDQELTKMRETAGGKKEILDHIVEYEKIKLKEIGEVREKSLNEDFDNWLNMQMAIDQGNKTSADTFMVLEDLKKQGYRDTLKDMSKSHREELTLMEQGWKNFAYSTNSVFADVIGSGLRGEFNSLGEAWQSFCNGMVNAFIDAASRVAATQITNTLFGTEATSTSQATTGIVTSAASSAWDAISSWWNSTEFYADGGSHPGGLRVVGERGPELEFTGPSTILSNTDSKKWMSSMSGGSSGGKISDKFLALAQAMQQAGMTASEARSYISDMANATAVYTSELSNNGSSIGESIAQTSSSTNAVASHTETTKESTAATKSESAATAKSTSRAFDFTDAMVDFGFGVLGTTAKVGLASIGFGILGVKAGELTANLTGLTGALESVKSSIKSTINDLQSSLGFAQDSASNFAGSGYTGFSQFGEGYDSGYNSDSDFAGSGYDGFGSFGDGVDGSDLGNDQGGDFDGSGYGGFDGFGDGVSGSDLGNDNDGGYFASGGIHRGGWRLVGERGPELEYTPPSRIFTNTDTKSILGQSDKTAAAISDLKEVVIGAIMASSEKMRKIENTVMRWEKIGLPAARA